MDQVFLNGSVHPLYRFQLMRGKKDKVLFAFLIWSCLVVGGILEEAPGVFATISSLPGGDVIGFPVLRNLR
jgi:hypothetical protein